MVGFQHHVPWISEPLHHRIMGTYLYQDTCYTGAPLPDGDHGRCSDLQRFCIEVGLESTKLSSTLEDWKLEGIRVAGGYGGNVLWNRLYP